MSLQRTQALPSSQFRPGSGIPGAQPSANGPLGSGSHDQPIFRLNLLRALQLHRRMALGFALGGLLLAVAYVVKAWPVYNATSQIYVQPSQTKVMSAGPDSSLTSNSAAYDSFVQQQVQSAANPEVLLSALHKLKPGSWQRQGESEQAASARLGGAIEVARVGTSYEVAITSKSKDPQLAAQMANAVAASIVARASGEGNAGNVQRIAVLKEERDRIQNGLNSDYSEQDDLNKQLGMAAVGTEAPDLIDADIGRTREELIKAQTDHDQAEARYAAMGAGKGESSAAIDAEAEDLVAADAGLTSMKTSLNARRATLITQMSNLTPNNPEYKQYSAELAKINGSLDGMMKDLRAKAAGRIQEKLHTDLVRTAGVESRLNGQLRQLTGAAASATPKMQRASDLATDIARLRLRYTSVDEQLHNLMLENITPGAVHQSVVAMPPLRPTISGILKKALPCALGGLLLGLLAASIANHFDSKIYLASDIEQVLGIAPMAVLPDFDEVSNDVSGEHLLRLSTAIEHARKQGDLNNCIFTGTSSGVGVTTLTGRVRDILKAMGRPTVLLDSSRTPPPAPRTNSTGEEPATQRGSRSTALLRQVAQENETEQENLVLTDTAPLLISAETEYLARFVDCAIVIVQSGVTTRAQLLAAANTLQRLNVAAVGFVLNRVKLGMADPAFRHSVREIEEHHRAQSVSTARRTERTSYVADRISPDPKELPRESTVRERAPKADPESSARIVGRQATHATSQWPISSAMKQRVNEPGAPPLDTDLPWWLSDARPAPQERASQQPSQQTWQQSSKPSQTEKPRASASPARPALPAEPNPRYQAPAKPLQSSKPQSTAKPVPAAKPLPSWENASGWSDDFKPLNIAKAAPTAVMQSAPVIVAEAARVAAAPKFAETVVPVAETAPKFTETASEVFAKKVSQVFAEKLAPTVAEKPLPIVAEKATPIVAEKVAPVASAPVALPEAAPAAPPIRVQVPAPVPVEAAVPSRILEPAPVAAPVEAPPRVERDKFGNEIPSRLNPLRGLLFSVGLKNLNNLNKAKGLAPAVEGAHPAPKEREPERTVIARTFTQFAEPVTVPVPVAVPEPAAVPEPTAMPVAEPPFVETQVASAPQKEVTPEVKTLPEFLPPREFVPVQETAEERERSSSSGWSRGGNSDDVMILPSRRGQYKR